MSTATQERSKMDELRDALGEELFGPDSRGESFMREQFDARWATESEGIQASIDALREAVSIKPPSAERPLRPMEELGLEYDRLAAREVLGLFDANGFNPAAMGAELDDQFDSTREYLQLVVASRNGYAADPRVRLITEAGDVKEPRGGPGGRQAVLTGEELELGGALVPEEYRAAMYAWALEPTSFRSMATVMPMNSSTLVMPTVRDSDHSTGAPFGIVPDWLEAGDEIEDSEPTFGQVRLTAHAVAYRTVLNNTFLADSIIAAQQFIFGKYPQTMMWEENRRFLKGDGAGLPQGAINAPCAVDAGTPAATFTATDAVNMLVQLYEPAGRRAVWVMSRRFMPALRADERRGERRRAALLAGPRDADPGHADGLPGHLVGACPGACQRRRHHADRLVVLPDRRPPGAQHGGLGALPLLAQPDRDPRCRTAGWSALDGRGADAGRREHRQPDRHAQELAGPARGIVMRPEWNSYGHARGQFLR